MRVPLLLLWSLQSELLQQILNRWQCHQSGCGSSHAYERGSQPHCGTEAKSGDEERNEWNDGKQDLNPSPDRLDPLGHFLPRFRVVAIFFLALVSRSNRAATSGFLA